jgi:hypothetical protein
MFNYSKPIMALSIAGLVAASYGGEFTLKKADHDLLLKRRMLAWEMSASSLQEVRPQMKVPDGLIEPKVKAYYSDKGASPQLLVFKSSKEAKTFDRVIIDQAANKDFTDDPVLTFGPELPVDVKWQPKGRDATDYRIYLVNVPIRSESRWDVALLPALWREGTVTLAGKPVRAVMQRSWSQRTLIIDCDGDGQLSFDRQSRSEWFQVTTYMSINNAFYKTVLGASDNDLDLEPFNGPFGKLELTGEMVPKGNDVMVSLVLGKPAEAGTKRIANDYIAQTALTNQPIVVPAGEYAIPYGYVIEQGKDGKYINFSEANRVVIRPDQVTPLNLGPAKEELSVVQRERILTINRVKSFTGVSVITYGSVPGEPRVALTVDVVDAADPAKIIVGRTNMEYG